LQSKDNSRRLRAARKWSRGYRFRSSPKAFSTSPSVP